MINNYEIKTIENEEVLYLFLDFSVEFAKLKKKDVKKKTLAKEIDEFLKRKNIIFTGTKIVLMVGSLMVGTCLLKKPILNSDNSYNYSTNIMTVKEIIKDDKDIAKKEEKIEDVTVSEIKKDDLSSKKDTNSTSNKTPAKNENTPLKPPVIANNKKPIKVDTSPSKSPEKEVINKKMVTLKRSNGIIETLELEEYLIGVVAAEMPASFHSEALKAQAIAARTYALKAMQDNVILTDTVSTQAYKDNAALKKLWGSSYNTYYNKIKKAVEATSGLAMYYNGSLINAFYHSTSNGYTEDAKAVFGNYPYLKSVDSSIDKTVSSYQKNASFSYEQISNKLGIALTSLSNIEIKRNNSGRVDTIIIDNNIYSGIKFRTSLGLRSTDFDINLNEEVVTITTRGYGHGVGMSQYGANGYAKNGWNYNKILKHYYSGITIKKY